MSAGKFERSKYQQNSDSTRIHWIKIQPETKTFGTGTFKNDPPTGDVNQKGLMKSSKSKKEIGKSPAKVVLQFGDDAPEGYLANSRITIPLLNNGIQNEVESKYKAKPSGSYQTKTITVVGYIPEDIK